MGRRGAEFSDIQPRGANGAIPQNANSINLAAATFGTGIGIDTATIQQITPLNSFRLGQQIFFHLGVFNPNVGGNFLTRIRLKPWWLRPNLEYRAPGDPTYNGIDQFTFLRTSEQDNRYVWIPSPKRLDITEYQAVSPPVPAPVRHSDSLMLDDIWTLDMPAGDDAAYIAKYPAPQQVSRWIAFLYPAMGYALGFTAEQTTQQGGALGSVRIALTWAVGTLGGTNYQESLG